MTNKFFHFIVASLLLCWVACDPGGPPDDTTTTTSVSDGSAEDLIDVHGHAGIDSSSTDPSGLVTLLGSWNIKNQMLMHPPSALMETTDTTELINYLSSYPEQFCFMYGGFELQPILHGLGRPTEFTVENVYPNGGGPDNVDEKLTELQQISENQTQWEAEFKSRARSAAESGLYVGFGEIAPLHFSLRNGHPSIEYPADHSMLLWLSDLAAEYGMPIDIHLEATDDTLVQLENLLHHNSDTVIIWGHTGWSNTGMATAELLSQMMAKHENLYLTLKLREAHSTEREVASPLDSSGQLKEEWRSLLETYADRVMVGMDLKFLIDSDKKVNSSLESIKSLLDQLSPEIAKKIGYDTAATLFGL